MGSTYTINNPDRKINLSLPSEGEIFRETSGPNTGVYIILNGQLRMLEQRTMALDPWGGVKPYGSTYTDTNPGSPYYNQQGTATNTGGNDARMIPYLLKELGIDSLQSLPAYNIADVSAYGTNGTKPGNNSGTITAKDALSSGGFISSKTPPPVTEEVTGGTDALKALGINVPSTNTGATTGTPGTSTGTSTGQVSAYNPTSGESPLTQAIKATGGMPADGIIRAGSPQDIAIGNWLQQNVPALNVGGATTGTGTGTWESKPTGTGADWGKGIEPGTGIITPPTTGTATTGGTTTTPLANIQAGYSMPKNDYTAKLADLSTQRTTKQAEIDRLRQDYLSKMTAGADEANKQAAIDQYRQAVLGAMKPSEAETAQRANIEQYRAGITSAMTPGADELAQRQAYLTALDQTEQETGAMTQLTDIQKQMRDTSYQAQAGMDVAGGQAIPMAPIIGQQQNIMQNATRIGNQLTNEANTVSDMLKLYQTQRQGTLEKAKTSLGWSEQDRDQKIQTAKLQLGWSEDDLNYLKELREGELEQAQTQLGWSEDDLQAAVDARKAMLEKAGTQLGWAEDDMASILDMEDKFADLDKEERNYANQILEFAIDAYAGTSVEQIQANPELLQSLTDLATRSGMPLNFILQAIQTAGDKLSESGGSTGGGGGGGGYTPVTPGAPGTEDSGVPTTQMPNGDGTTTNVPTEFASPDEAAKWLASIGTQLNDEIWRYVLNILDTPWTNAAAVERNLQALVSQYRTS